MKKIFAMLTCSIMLLSSVNTSAQIDTSTTQKLLQYIMQPLDKNQIPTGFLEEYGCPILPMATFNGTLTDSNRIDMNLWRTLYLQLQTGWTRNTSNPLPAITAVNTTIKQNISSSLPIPIPLLIGQYNTVRTDAFSSNLLSYNSSTNQVFDVSGRTQSPYNTNYLFAACANKQQTLMGGETFIIPSNLIWNNTNKAISQLQIDFANGQGFQNITIGSPISVSYADTGYKRWTIKAVLSDNSVLQCYNDYYVIRTASSVSRFQTIQSIVPAWGLINPVGGVHSGATIWVNYSNRSRTNTLRKPLIVFEGYDVSTIAPALQFNYSVRDFITAISVEPGNSFDFNGQLDDIAGYDLVFVDFNDGADDIVRNAAIVQEVINRVNANKVLDDRFGNIRQQNVVLGLSMGGLCARYALANMTKNFPGTPTETRLLITHDSPHRGANVPLGLQYMIRMMGNVQLFGFNVFDIFPDYNDAIGLLNAPATQQLLLYRAITENTFANNTFLDATYMPMITFATTGPQPTYRFIATSLGNECAHPLFNPGKTFINLGAGVSAGITGRILFFRVPILTYKLAAEVEAYALPSAGSTNKIARVYTINNLRLFGFINIFRQLYNNTAYAPGNHLAVDGVPGSVSPLLDLQALNQLTGLPIFNPVSLYVQFPLGPFLGGYFGVYAYNAGVSFDFTFVSVGSALDISPYNANTFSQNYVNGTNSNYPSTSETFIAQETNTASGTSNNVHIRFTARNSQWLFNEMENLNNSINCSGECFNPYFISGNSILCTTNTYTIPGFPRGASISWSASPSGRVIINSPTLPKTTITRVSDGTVTLTAVITNACGGQPITLQKTITVGVPGVGGSYFTNGQQQPLHIWFGNPSTDYNNACNLQTTYTNMQITGATSVVWSKVSSSPSNISWSQSGNDINFYFWNVGQTAVFKLTTTNACGTTVLDFGFKSITCGGGGGCNSFSVSPNPATGSLKVIVPNIPPPCLSAANGDSKNTEVFNRTITEIKIYDNSGNLKKIQKENKSKQATINLTGFKSGVYFIEISDGSYKERQQIIIQE